MEINKLTDEEKISLILSNLDNFKYIKMTKNNIIYQFELKGGSK